MDKTRFNCASPNENTSDYFEIHYANFDTKSSGEGFNCKRLIEYMHFGI